MSTQREDSTSPPPPAGTPPSSSDDDRERHEHSAVPPAALMSHFQLIVLLRSNGVAERVLSALKEYEYSGADIACPHFVLTALSSDVQAKHRIAPLQVEAFARVRDRLFRLNESVS